MASSAQDDLRSALDRLETTRDELRVQMALARAEARKEWERLEERWSEIRPHVQRMRSAGTRGAEALDETTRQFVRTVADELSAAYRKLRQEREERPDRG